MGDILSNHAMRKSGTFVVSVQLGTGTYVP